MLITCLASGMGLAARHLKLAVVLWMTTLVLALPAAFAFAAWWWGALAYAIPGRTGDLGAFIDMVEYNETNVTGLVVAALGGTILVSLVVNAFVSVGVLEVLIGARRARMDGTVADSRRLLHRFGRGGGRFFLRSLGVLVVALFVAAIVVSLAAALVGAAVRPLDDAMSLAAAWTHLLLPIAVVALFVLFFCGVVVDLARIELVRRDTRNPLVAYWRGLTLSLRKWWTAMWIWGLVLLLVAVALALQQTVAPARAPAPVAFIGIQVIILVVAWLRIGLLGAQVELAARVRPDPATAVTEPPPMEPDLSYREPEPVLVSRDPGVVDEAVLVPRQEQDDLRS